MITPIMNRAMRSNQPTLRIIGAPCAWLSKGNGENGTRRRMRQTPRGAAGLEHARGATAVIADCQDIGPRFLHLRYHSLRNVPPPDCQRSVGEPLPGQHLSHPYLER